MGSLKHYTAHELRRIRAVCSWRLPPASMVQAMFLYEMQRETEVESLFQGQLFRLARAEDTSVAAEARLGLLEKRIAQLEQRAIARDIEQRLATSRMRLDRQDQSLNKCTEHMIEVDARLAEVEEQLKSRQLKLTDSAPTCNASLPTDSTEDTTDASPAWDAAVIKAEIDVLFHDRDGILDLINEAKERIDKLEDNVRALTLQNTAAKTPRLDTPPQRLPMHTPHGTPLDLGVPKGSPLVSLKENRPYSTKTIDLLDKQWST